MPIQHPINFDDPISQPLTQISWLGFQDGDVSPNFNYAMIFQFVFILNNAKGTTLLHYI